ncbi:MAG: glycerol-3-phosphate acyltransferase [Candidatus Saccharicenans sp.]|nr:glycerol-3-phosphate acyltransferase [Candidatus Saccharicenans sp.]MDH7492403.1 glycerol-3-phosphate acyltransferase [Candidatus Saccharicenans sp.]
MSIILSLVTGYLLGSISPSYILGRLLKGIDIRQHSDHNAGTVNTYRILGLWPAVITAVFDLFKGLLAMYLSWKAGGSALTAIGAIALFFLVLDLARLVSARVNIFFFQKIKRFYRLSEQKKFSSITIFLFALFLTILIFEKNLAILAASFLTIGDFFSKIFGVAFGRLRIFNKPWKEAWLISMPA